MTREVLSLIRERINRHETHKKYLLKKIEEDGKKLNLMNLKKDIDDLNETIIKIAELNEISYQIKQQIP